MKLLPPPGVVLNWNGIPDCSRYAEGRDRGKMSVPSTFIILFSPVLPARHIIIIFLSVPTRSCSERLTDLWAWMSDKDQHWQQFKLKPVLSSNHPGEISKILYSGLSHTLWRAQHLICAWNVNIKLLCSKGGGSPFKARGNSAEEDKPSARHHVAAPLLIKTEGANSGSQAESMAVTWRA